MSFQQVVDDQAATHNPPQEGTFGTEQPTVAPQQPQAPVQLDDGSIVVNGKIFRPEAAVKKIEHADQHIRTLEQENAEKDETTLTLLARIEALEADRNKTDKVDQLIETVRAAQPAPEPAPTQEISKEELVEAAVNTLKEQEVAKQQGSNLDACIAQAQEAFGDDFANKIDAAGAAHGLTVEQTVEMAKNQPSVFKALFIPAKVANGQPDTTRSSIGGYVEKNGIQPPTQRKSYLNMSAKERSKLIQDRMNALSNVG